MPTCNQLLDDKTLKHILDKIHKNVVVDDLTSKFDINDQQKITGGRGGSSLFKIPYKGKIAVIKTYRIKKLPNINNFDSFWLGNMEANGLIREIVIGCYFKNHKLFQNNIPKFYEWGIIKSNDNYLHIYYIQELIEGINLSGVTRNNNMYNGKPIFKNIDQLRRFHTRILKMLQKLYTDHKFIHNDLKMDNFMVKIKGDTRTPYMIDFGHASNLYLPVEKNLKFMMINIKWNIYNMSKYRSDDDRSKQSIKKSKDKTHKIKYDLKFIVIGAIQQAKKLFSIDANQYTLNDKDVKTINKLPFDKQIQYILDNNSFYHTFKSIPTVSDTKKSKRKTLSRKTKKSVKRV